jgi:hypothetical protein
LPYQAAFTPLASTRPASAPSPAVQLNSWVESAFGQPTRHGELSRSYDRPADVSVSVWVAKWVRDSAAGASVVAVVSRILSSRITITPMTASAASVHTVNPAISCARCRCLRFRLISRGLISRGDLAAGFMPTA